MSIIKTVHYRKFDRESIEANVENLIKIALDTDHKPGVKFSENEDARQFSARKEHNLKRISLYISRSFDYIFGTIVLYSPDEWAPVLLSQQDSDQQGHVSLDEAIRHFEVADRPPAEGSDYVKGISYWLIKQDHVFVLQHVALQVKAYEEYFSDLFRATGIISKPDDIVLEVAFNKDRVGGDLGAIKQISIGGRVSYRPERTEPSSEKVIEIEKSIATKKEKVFEKALAVMKAIFSDADADKILGSIPEDADLEVDVRFGYKAKRTSISRVTMDELAKAARNLPDGEVRAIGKDGSSIGDDIRLSTDMPFLPMRDGSSLLELNDTREKLLLVYQRFVEDGKIRL